MTLTHYGLREWGGALVIALIAGGVAWLLYRHNWHVTALVIAGLGVLFFAGVAFSQKIDA